MSAAVLEAPGRIVADTVDGGGRATLEELVSGVWEGLAGHRTVACPVCGGEMAPRYGAGGAEPVGGRCTSCHSTLGCPHQQTTRSWRVVQRVVVGLL